MKNILSARTLSLVGLFILALIIGRLVLDRPEPQAKPATQATSTAKNEINGSKTLYQTDRPADQTMGTCAQTLKAKAQTEKTQYDSGTLLVGFKEGVTFDAAKIALSMYGLSIKDEPQAKDNYPANRLLTATGARGHEFEKICLLRQDASVRYAGLNVLVPLHE